MARGSGSVLAAIGLALLLSAPGASARAADTAAVPDAAAAIDDLRRWVLETGDNQGLAFVIVDKREGRVAAYDAGGGLIGSAPALLGLALGDDSPPGIGDRALADIGPSERITPAGRFVAQLGENLSGNVVLWVDYDAAISLHPVATGKRSERRQARLDSPGGADNRISYGCINVPAPFYASVIRPMFQDGEGVVYVLPETRSMDAEFFGRTTGPGTGTGNGM
ncbi:MAG: L,D-transpeptidase [Caulobacteraceae bacterium]|nr:MAG: L,D-transpeptidase [Caulobacteraceae bacterium]